MRLISFNYSQLAETVITASSSNINFPFTNIRHEHRSKEWRSSGHFVITAANKTLVFDEGGGDLTASLTEGTYSVASLRAEIASKMNAAGAQEYTVGYAEAFGIWSFSADVSFTLKSTSTLLPALGFNAANVTGTVLTAPRPAIHTQEHVMFDLKTTEEIDSVVLLWGKGQYKMSPDAEIRIQANATANFAAPAVDQVLSFSNKFEVASHYFSTPQSYRYWRVVIKDPANPTGYVNLGVVILGQKEEIDDMENGFTYGQSDNSVVTRTEFGQEYADIYPVTAQLSLDFKAMDYPMAEKFILMYQRMGVRSPVFVALDPEGSVFDKDCFAIYGKFRGALAAKHSFGVIFDTGLSIEEVN